MDDLDRLALAAARETVHVDFIDTPTEAELNTLQAAKQVLAMFGERDDSDFRPPSKFIRLRAFTPKGETADATRAK
jgi:hypothetical protein